MSKDFVKMEVVEDLNRFYRQREILEDQIKQYENDLMLVMDVDEETVGGYLVKRNKRTTFDIDIEKAKELGAVKIVTKTTESIDTPTLHKLADSGVEIPTKTTKWLTIKPVEETEEKENA